MSNLLNSRAKKGSLAFVLEKDTSNSMWYRASLNNLVLSLTKYTGKSCFIRKGVEYIHTDSARFEFEEGCFQGLAVFGDRRLSEARRWVVHATLTIKCNK